MILTPLPLDNPWKRSAIGFFMFNMSSTLMFWIVFDMKQYSQVFLEQLFIFIPLISIFMFLLGSIFPAVNRVKYFVLILGSFGILPILFASVAPFFLYMLISNFYFQVKFFLVGMYASLSSLWIYVSIKKTARIEKKFNYLRSQISHKNNRKIINRGNILDFSRLGRNLPNRRNNLLRNIVIPISFMGYPLQKLFSALGGDAAVLGFVSILSVPLSMYFMGKIASGYYLWVYSIGKLEREYKSKIVMLMSPALN